jgi:PAS domain S-box-containing protein
LNYKNYTDTDTAGEVYHVFNGVYTTGTPEKVFGWEIIRKDGSMRHVEISVSPMKDVGGQIIGFRGMVRDVSDHKKMEKALKESEKNYRELYEEAKRAEEVYRSVLHTSADAIVIYDLEGNPTYLNPAFTKIFGWTLEEVAGKRIPFLPETEKDATMAGIMQIIEEGKQIQGFETKRLTKDGRILDVNISGSRYNDHEGNPAGMLVVLRDTSESKRLKAQFQAAQRMEAIGTLAGGIAHDFNNLLMGVAGNISLIMLDMDSNNQQYERLKSVEQYVHGGANLTRQLLGLARGGKYDARTTDLNEIVQKSSKMFGRTKKEVAVHPKYQENIWTVEVDQGQIEQVLMNLYVNAWQAMPNGGDLYLQTENVVLDESDTGPYGFEPGRFVKISVTDTGAGMDKKTQEKIFDPFFTTKEMGRGTGLGLASVYGIVSNHRGIINVYSEKGYGSTFNIYLPTSENPLSEIKEPSKDIIMGYETVLLVDDEDVMINVGKEMIQKLGYNVSIARNGEEAIGIYEKDRDTIDLIILDMIMPKMGGGETFDRLKQIDQGVKVLLSSGYSMDDRASDIIKRGCKGFMQKPFSILELSHKLREILDKH